MCTGSGPVLFCRSFEKQYKRLGLAGRTPRAPPSFVCSNGPGRTRKGKIKRNRWKKKSERIAPRLAHKVAQFPPAIASPEDTDSRSTRVYFKSSSQWNRTEASNREVNFDKVLRLDPESPSCKAIFFRNRPEDGLRMFGDGKSGVMNEQASFWSRTSREATHLWMFFAFQDSAALEYKAKLSSLLSSLEVAWNFDPGRSTDKPSY